MDAGIGTACMHGIMGVHVRRGAVQAVCDSCCALVKSMQRPRPGLLLQISLQAFRQKKPRLKRLRNEHAVNGML